MKMYVANCTQQVQNFVYRVPGQNGIRSQRIEIGSQVRLSGDLQPEEIKSIVEQHTKYGMVDASTIKNRPGRKIFAGVCYSIDKPVSIDAIQLAVMLNTEVLVERGVKIRQEAAIAVSNSITEQNPNLETLEMSVVEERKDGGEPDVAEGHRVTEREDAGGDQPAGRRVGGSRRRRGNG